MERQERKENGVINIVQLEVDCKKMEEAAEKMKRMAATLPGIIQTAAEILEEKGMGLELSVPLEEICEDMGEVLVIGHVACRMIADAMKEGEADE